MYIDLHLWSRRFSFSPSQPSFVASAFLTLPSSPPSSHLFNRTSRQYPHLYILNHETKETRDEKEIHFCSDDPRSPVSIQIGVDRREEDSCGGQDSMRIDLRSGIVA